MMSGYRIFPAGHPHGMGHVRPHYHGFCSSCCHPISKCCCGHRECRKVAKEILADPMVKAEEVKDLSYYKRMTEFFARTDVGETPQQPAPPAGGGATAPSLTPVEAKLPRLVSRASAVIGGGCCVHLSIEYMPLQETWSPAEATAARSRRVMVEVFDSAGTVLVWAKMGFDGYNIKEDIVTTNPGARLTIGTLNAVARVRWCEVFSC